MHSTQGMMKPRVAAALVLVLALAAGCAGKYGSIRWDTDVGLTFETALVLPGHRYYTTGSDTVPDAILALREDHPLSTNLWREVAMTSEILARLVDRMRNTRSVGPFGRVVLDDRGGVIGGWYSYLDPTSVKLLEDGGVVIQPPVGTINDMRPASRGN